MPCTLERRKKVILTKVNSIRQRWTRPLAAITLSLSFQFLNIKQLRLNRSYGLKLRRWPEGGAHEPAASKESHHDKKKLHMIEVQLIESKSMLPNIDKYVNYYNNFSVCYYLFATVRATLIFLVNLDYLSEYRLLDCYLLGRLAVNGRLGEPLKYFAIWGTCYLVFWRLLMLFGRPKMRLYCFEFLMYDSNELMLEEAKLKTTKTRTASSLERTNHNYLFVQNTGLASEYDSYQSSLLQLRNLITIQQAERAGTLDLPGLVECPMRLNRTTKQWKSLSQALSFCWLLFLTILTFLVPFFLAMMVPVVYTRRGFELVYGPCCAWIEEYSNAYNDTRSYSHIYTIRRRDDLNDNVSHHLGDHSSQKAPVVFLPFKDWTPLNVYHVSRLLLDHLDNFMAYCDCVGLFLANACIAVLISCDVRYYSNELRPQLEQLNAHLRTSTGHPNNKRPGRKQLDARIHFIQSSLVDFFHLVYCYGKFASLLTIFTISGWLSYSALVAKWIFTPTDEKPKLEWYVLHVYTTFYTALLVGCFSQVRLACRRLYPLICSSASLDTGYGDRKRRWALILKYYWPRPLYCFTLMNSSELSWLFLLKLFTWLMSAFVVAFSFFAIHTLDSRRLS